jgi:hypothetical protein
MGYLILILQVATKETPNNIFLVLNEDRAHTERREREI